MSRHYTREDMGPMCPYCRLRVPAKVKERSHPTCGPEAAILLGLSEAAFAAAGDG